MRKDRNGLLSPGDNSPQRLFFGDNQIAVDGSLQLSVPINHLLYLQQRLKTSLDRKAGEFPFNNTGEPDKRACVIEADGAVGLLGLKDLKARGLKAPALFRKVQMGEGLFRSRQYQLDQITVVILPHLFGDENTALAQQTKNLSRVEAAVPVENQIKCAVFKGDVGGVPALLEVDSQRQQFFRAQRDVGRVSSVADVLSYGWFRESKNSPPPVS